MEHFAGVTIRRWERIRKETQLLKEAGLDLLDKCLLSMRNIWKNTEFGFEVLGR